MSLSYKKMELIVLALSICLTVSAQSARVNWGKTSNLLDFDGSTKGVERKSGYLLPKDFVSEKDEDVGLQKLVYLWVVCLLNHSCTFIIKYVCVIYFVTIIQFRREKQDVQDMIGQIFQKELQIEAKKLLKNGENFDDYKRRMSLMLKKIQQLSNRHAYIG